MESFLATPLMSNDPFEVEWWVRHAQERYKQETPDPGKMAWNALQKAQSQGSHSTLAALRVSQCGPDSAQAELLTFGDSCILIEKAERVLSFPLHTASDFERAPVCVPSKRSIFNRHFHCCQTRSIRLEADNVVVLATDAVSKWIISAASGRYTHPRRAFEEIRAQTPATWAAFIAECRTRGEMIDDDCTALIVTLKQEAFADSTQLGTTTVHSQAIRESRKIDFVRAMQAGNKELLAIIFGDGVDLSLERVTISQDEIQQARRVADALQEVLQVLRQEVNGPDAATKVGLIWQQHAPLLLDEPCAENLRQTLTHIGVPLQPSLHEEQHQSLQGQQELEQQATEVITLTLQQEQQVIPTQQRGLAQQFAQAALQSMNVRQMAEAFETVAVDPQIVSPDELNLLWMAHAFIEAYRTNRDEAIIAIFEEMQRPLSAGLIKLSPQEEERIELALQRRMAKTQAALATLRQNEAHDLQKRPWFVKLIWRKGS